MKGDWVFVSNGKKKHFLPVGSNNTLCTISGFFSDANWPCYASRCKTCEKILLKKLQKKT